MNRPSQLQDDLPDAITVVAFGACLIGGHPFPEEDGFFRLAVRDAAAETGVNIRHSITSIPSITAAKAVEMLAEKALSQNPDIVVFQFGQTDARVPTRGLLREVLGPSVVSKQHVVVEDRPARLKNRIVWFLRGCAGLALGAHAITSRADYRRSISQLVDGVVLSGAYPIVFTPFIQGCFLPDAWAQCYSRDLVNDLGGRTDVCVIDGWSLLSRHPRNKMLLHNGVHLTRQAHALLAQSLKTALVNRLRASVSSVPSVR
jgi:hypothetical protein